MDILSGSVANAETKDKEENKMRVNDIRQKFAPITITLDVQEDLDSLVMVLGALSKEKRQVLLDYYRSRSTGKIEITPEKFEEITNGLFDDLRTIRESRL